MGGICSNLKKSELEEEEAAEEVALQQQQQQQQEQPQQEAIYLNHAGQCRFSAAVRAAGIAALQRDPWDMVGISDEQAVRGLFAQLIHAENASEISVMPSTAFAITLAAHNIARLALKKQHKTGKILLLQDQYPSAVYPWQDLCDKMSDKSSTNTTTTGTPTKNTSTGGGGTGWSIHVVPYPEDEYGNVSRTWTDSIMEHLNRASNSDIRVVVLPPLHWADGRAIDLVKIGAICKRRNIDFIVDATQAVGIHEVNVQLIQPSLLACSSHKWLRGPSGTSLVYLDPKLHTAWQPLDQHERGRRSPGDYNVNAATRHFMNPATGYYPQLFYRDARKFDAGGKANPLLMPMLRVALQEVNNSMPDDADPKPLQHQLQALMQPFLDWCTQNGFVVPHEPHAFHLIGIRPPPQFNLTPEQFVAICQHWETHHQIYITARCGGFRISPYLGDTKPHHIRTLIAAWDDVFFGPAASTVWQHLGKTKHVLAPGTSSNHKTPVVLV